MGQSDRPPPLAARLRELSVLDHFGLLAPFYDRLISPPDADQLRQLLDLPAPGVMLDVGGGTGRVAVLLQALVDRLILSDPSFKMLRQAQSKAGNLMLVQGQAERLPFPDGFFDRVLVVDALHHFRDQQQAVHELARVVRPGGRLVIEEPNINRLSGKLVAFFEKLALMGSRFYPPAALREMAAATGLDASIVTNHKFAAWIVAVKPGG